MRTSSLLMADLSSVKWGEQFLFHLSHWVVVKLNKNYNKQGLYKL